jgi:AGCS family alanine or glycine:cation symporter
MFDINEFMATLNGILWHETVLFTLLATGVVFTIWSRFAQFSSLTHGIRVVRGTYDDPADPGAISHFQALSAALSATVGLGNIGGVALAISLGGPGAIFWMWVVGLIGMAIKLTEVCLSMIYRNIDDPRNPHGGPMWVASRGLSSLRPALAPLGRTIGVIFCLSLLVCVGTGGNMFQAWNVGEITQQYFGVPSVASGILLSVIVGSVIIGGITRIGAVAGTLVPFMVALYLVAGTYVLIVNVSEIPSMLWLIVTSAFSPVEADKAFIGGSAAGAFLFGMKRALFSNEAGQGSSPIAHSAARCKEPVREAVVAGLEPFVDTVVVCTFTALIILSTGVWNRAAEASYDQEPSVLPLSASTWTVETQSAPARTDGAPWEPGTPVYLIYEGDENRASANAKHRLYGEVIANEVAPGQREIRWAEFDSGVRPRIEDLGIYGHYAGATLTARAFDTVSDGLGKWLVTLAAWLFAVSTMISWAYYGEQGMVFLAGERSVMPYKFVFCVLIIIATLGLIRTDVQLDNLTGIGTGVMLFANVPIVWLFGHQAMRAYHDYMRRLRAGEFVEHR